MDALCALLDCALGFFPCYFLFGCKSTSSVFVGDCTPSYLSGCTRASNDRLHTMARIPAHQRNPISVNPMEKQRTSHYPETQSIVHYLSTHMVHQAMKPEYRRAANHCSTVNIEAVPIYPTNTPPTPQHGFPAATTIISPTVCCTRYTTAPYVCQGSTPSAQLGRQCA